MVSKTIKTTFHYSRLKKMMFDDVWLEIFTKEKIIYQCKTISMMI